MTSDNTPNRPAKRHKQPRVDRRPNPAHPDGCGCSPPVDGQCGARRADHSRCDKPAGWGTDYRVGPCRRHGGAHASGRKHAARITYERQYAGSVMFGQTVERSPALGILHVASKVAGFAAYLEDEITRTADPATGRIQLVETVPTAGGGTREDIDVRVKLLLDVWERYARICKMAGDLGIEKLKVDLFASFRTEVLDLLEDILRDVGVDPDDPQIGAKVTRRLTLITAASDVIAGDGA